jgi:hypothetical protein
VKVWGDRLETGALTGVATSMKFQLSKLQLLVAVRSYIAVFNQPTLTGLRLRIYSDRGGSPGALMFTSENQYDLADMTTHAFRLKEFVFEFNTPHGVWLPSNEAHHLVWTADTYVGDATSHIALMKDWPRPVNLPREVDLETLGVQPYQVAFIGAKP